MIYILLLVSFLNTFIYLSTHYSTVLTSMDIVNVTFLNFSLMSNYGLSKLPINFTITFILITALLIHLVTRDVYENESYYTMIFHRSRISDYFKSVIKFEIFNSVFKTVLTSVVLMVFLKVVGISISNVMVSFIYIFRYFSLFVVAKLAFIIVNFKIQSTSSKSMYVYIFSVLLIIADALMGTHIITFSGSINVELIYLVGELVLIYVLYHLLIKSVKEIFIHDRI